MKNPKYRNKKTEIDGILFDSKREAERYRGLKILEKSGVISGLTMQVKYELISANRRADGKLERSCCYVADFEYITDGKKVTEDCKGYRTPDYIIKRKLMLSVHGITIKET